MKAMLQATWAALFLTTILLLVLSPSWARADLDWCRSSKIAPVQQSPSAQTTTGTFQLVVYYVLPSDIPYEDAVYDRIVDASLDVQAWYQCASGGVTWEFASPAIVQVYYADHDRQHYADDDWWGPLLGEMSANGEPIWQPGTMVAIWARGAGGWAGGAQSCGNQCGTALLGVELFPEFNDPDYSEHVCPGGVGVGAWPCTPEGAFAHELGHTLGLPHPADVPATAAHANHSVMQTHWNYPDYAPASESPWGLLSLERQSIRGNPFMKSAIGLSQRYPDCDIVNLPSNGSIPDAEFSVNENCEDIQTTNTSSGASLYYWTFGDGGVSNAVSPAYTYSADGSYELRLRASGTNAMMAEQVVTLSVGATAPPRPQLLSPSNGATAVPVTGVLDWANAQNAVEYVLRVRCPSGETIVSTSLTQSQYSYNLPAADYQWFVTAYNDCGETLGPSDTWTFSVGAGSTCGLPVMTEPVDGSECVGTPAEDPRRAIVALRWDPIPGASRYFVQIRRGESCNDNGPIAVSGNEYLAEVEWEETYSWNVKEDCPCSDYAECRSFTTALRPDIHAPNLDSPNLNETDVPLSGLLEWDAVGQAAGYRVQLGTTCGNVDSVDVVGTRWAYSDLEQNTEYFWRVAAIDGCGRASEYSDCWNFRTMQVTGINRIYFPGGLAGSPGHAFEIPILVENLTSLQRIRMNVQFPKEVFLSPSWTLSGTRSAEIPGVNVTVNASAERADITIAYSSVSACPQSLAPGVGAVIKLVFNIKPTAPLGVATLTIDDNAEFRLCGGGTNHPTVFDGQVDIEISTAVGNLPPIVGLTALAHYPNPFTTSATIDVGLPNASPVEVQIFDVSGRRVSNRSIGMMGKGWQQIALQATDDAGQRLPSGVYFYRITAAGEAITRKMVITR